MYPTPLEEIIRYIFKNRDLLNEAVTHSSYFNERKDERRSKNEKLEYLGDAILNSIVSVILYKKFHDKSEGFLSNARSCLVKRETLTKIAKDINLHIHVTYGNGEISVPEESKVLSNMFEALIGALYLDSGMRKTTQVIKTLFAGYFDEEKLQEKNPKNRLQEFSQREYGILPRYRLTRRTGKSFSVYVYVGKDFKAKGVGKSKKEAEQKAAKELLGLLTDSPVE